MSEHEDNPADAMTASTLLISKPADIEPSVTSEPVTRHNVFENADLLVKLLISEIDIGYKLVTYYTASSTLYIAIVGVTAQQYFAAAPQNVAKASALASFGLALSLISLAAPFGLHYCRREIERRAERYALALALPPERFSVIRFGTWLSLCAFGAIAAAWTYVVATA